jgi:hypothetical protein
VVFEIYFVVPYFEVFEEHNKTLIGEVDTIDFADFDIYF